MRINVEAARVSQRRGYNINEAFRKKGRILSLWKLWKPRIAGMSVKSRQLVETVEPQARIADSSSRNAVTFHPHAQRSAFRCRGVHLQSTLVALDDARLRHSPNSNRLS